MLSTSKQTFTGILTLKPSLTAFPFLLRPPARALTNTLHPARRAGAFMAAFRARMQTAIKTLRTGLAAREILMRAAANIGDRATEARRGDKLRARRARAGVAKEEAVMTALRTESAFTELTTRVRQRPRIHRRVLNLATEAIIGSRDQGFGIRETAFGARPVGGGGRGAIRGLRGPGLDAGEVEDGVASGGARPDGMVGAYAVETNEAGGEGG